METTTENNGTEKRQQTYGERAVGLSFNPSNDDEVHQIKKMYADIIDKMDKLKHESESGEVKRLCSISIHEAQTAQMWAVKAITWKE